MIRVFIGFDPRQPISYNVLQHSIIQRCTEPVAITPLILETLPIKRKGLTPFTFSRMLVPWLCNYEGKACFMDSDIVCTGDLVQLIDGAEGDHDLWVSKNKLRFEWSSVVVFDNARCSILTPDYIDNEANNPLALKWAKSIGDLDPKWNHLVGYDPNRQDGDYGLIHYTQGVPCFPETQDCDLADIWKGEANEMISAAPWEVLMGPSVHAKPVRERLAKQMNGAHA